MLTSNKGHVVTIWGQVSRETAILTYTHKHAHIIYITIL